MVTYNAEMLRHEANHFEELSQKFPDLRLEVESNGTYYYSDLSIASVNHASFETGNYDKTDITGMHNMTLDLHIDKCDKCELYYGIDTFTINNDLPSIKICYVDFLADDKLEISTFSYIDELERLKVTSDLLNAANLYVLNLIRNNSKIKSVKIDARLKHWLIYI